MKSKHNTMRMLSPICSFVIVFSMGARVTPAADPVVNVAWSQPAPPVLGQNYTVSIIPPASPAFPDVTLLTGDLGWRVWSTDTDNPNGVGDIGVISSPAAANFAVAIVNSSGGTSARNVKAIRLVPTGSNYFGNVVGPGLFGSLIGGV